MMGEGSTAPSRETMIIALVRELRIKIGARAIEVAEAQCKAAAEDSLEAWTAILTRLRSD